ncbi:MAG: hypothetical protein AB9M60_16140 [Leptothrix sp. (in: b-proteobacteria)]
MSAAVWPPNGAVPTLTDVVGFSSAPAALERFPSGTEQSSIERPTERLSELTFGLDGGMPLESNAAPDWATQGVPLGEWPMQPMASGGHEQALSLDASPPAAPDRVDPVAPSLAIDAALQDALARRVLADVQQQVERLLEYRLREALTPALQRMADALVQDVRDELAQTLNDVVRRAVQQVVARQRPR